MSIKEHFTRVLNNTKNFIIPNNVRGEFNSLKKEHLQALSERDTVSQMLFHRSYIEEDIGIDEKFGYYIMGDGKIGLVFELTPPAYLSESVENSVVSALYAMVKDGSVVHFNTFASSNIDNELEQYRSLKEENKNRSINLRNPEKIDSFIDNQIKYFKKWTQDSIMGQSGDMRVRNLRNTMSILFPYDTDIEEVKKQFNQLIGIFRELGIRTLPASKFIPLIKEFICPHLTEFPDSDDNITTINKQVTNGADIELCEDTGTIYYGPNREMTGKVLTTEKFAPQIDMFSYQNAFFDVMGADAQIHIPCRFMLSLTIEYSNIKKTRKAMLSKARSNHKNLAPIIGKLGKVFPDIKILKDESENVIQIDDIFGDSAVKGKWDLLIIDKNEALVQQACSAIKKSFEDIPRRWILKEETFSKIAFQIVLQSIPLNYSKLFQDNVKKQDMMFKSNCAQIAPMLSDLKGLGSKPTHFFIGRTGQIIGIDFFASQQNYNICIDGPQGSGKSALGNYLHLAGLAAGWDIRMIDFGRTYEKLNKNIGGQFIEFNKGNDLCLNFFTYINTTESVDLESRENVKVIDVDEFDTLVPIVGLMMGISLRNIYKLKNTSEKEKMWLSTISTFVRKALVIAYEMAQENAGMREVGKALESMRNQYLESDPRKHHESINAIEYMVNGLEAYTSVDGAFYRYYNGTNNINIKSKYLIAELDDISDSPLLPVVAMGLLQRMAQEAFIEYLKDKKTARLVGVDEAWKVLGSQIFSEFLEDFARRIRKYKGITLIITQTISEFNQSDAARVIYNTASFKISLPKPNDMVEAAIKEGMLDGKNKFNINLMKSIQFKSPHYNECYIKYANAQFVACVKFTPDDYWTFTSRPEDRSRIDDVMKSKGFNLNDTIWYLARKSEGIKEEEIKYLMSVKDRGKKGNLEWDEFFKDSLHNDKIGVAKQNIYDVKNRENPKIVGEELFMRIASGQTQFSNSYFKQAAIERGFYIDISKRFIDKCFNYILSINHTRQISINLDILEIKDKNFVEYLFEKIDKLDHRKENLIFDVVLNYDTKENILILLEFANSIKGHGVNIAFDNIDFTHLDIKTLLQINPKQFKINIEDLRDLIVSEQNANYAKSLIFSLLNSNTNNDAKTVFVKVENDDDLNLAEEFDVTYVQGYKYEKPQLIR